MEKIKDSINNIENEETFKDIHYYVQFYNLFKQILLDVYLQMDLMTMQPDITQIKIRQFIQ